MQALDDIALLQQYVDHGSEQAFATLVTRHIDRVYSVARRHTGDPHQAEEITQAVFVILAKKSRCLGKQVILAGWLYQTARLTALTFIRGEIRRVRREQEVCMQNAFNENESEVWTQIAPLLDTAMARLNETDRYALILRFFYGMSMNDIGATLGASEDSARMRIHRALEKLQNYFSKQGIHSTTAAITGAVSNHSVQAAPVVLAATTTALAVAKGASASASTTTLIHGALKLMAWTKAKTAIVAGAIVLLAAGTTTVAVKEIAAHRPQIWQQGFNVLITDKVPPQVTILPSLPSQSNHAAGSHNGKMLGVGQSIPEIIMAAHGYQFHLAQLSFPTTVPQGKYDYIANLPTGQ
ncbi:MAG TPA: sigma-70 family RNA polymerase sigma factor, partial [Desulfuromonadaceae bacterium]|nr:sigma-70 family RNA polymerase sigma factor [Desulfuromonadaceae bacterium]